MNFKISEKFEICKNINLVDLPEIKGQHRKFRTLVTSYIGKVWKSIFIPFLKISKCLQFREFFLYLFLKVQMNLLIILFMNLNARIFFFDSYFYF